MDIPIQLDDVKTIAAMKDPILRNYWITQGYHDLNTRFSAHMLGQGTWPMYGIWASKSVGVNMRQEEFPALVRKEYESAHQLKNALDRANRGSWLKRLGIVRALEKDTVIGTFENTLSAVSADLGEGNLTVFAELAPIYANMIKELDAGNVLQGEALETFIQAQSIDGTSENIEDFKTAIRNYFLALTVDDHRERVQRICYANLLAGLHEQRRLQGAIEKAMDAPITVGLANTRHIWFIRALAKLPIVGRLLRKLDADFFTVEGHLITWFQTLSTRAMMSITTPNGTFHLGSPLPPPPGAPLYPPDLEPVTLPELQGLLARLNKSGPDGTQTEAHNWAILGDRMNFIVALFRSRQQVADLHSQPFSAEQRKALADGNQPKGDS